MFQKQYFFQVIHILSSFLSQVQCKVKTFKKKFEKNKHDVMQKVDLLSASRCNLLSSTLAAYQQAMLKFWENTSKSMNQVAEQFKGYPSYQFQMLKSLNPMMEPDEKGSEETKEIKGDEETRAEKKDKGSVEEATEQTEDRTNVENDDDDTLICLDHSPTAENPASKDDDDDDDDALLETDLLGDMSEQKNTSEGLRDGKSPHFDLLGADEELPSRHGHATGGKISNHFCIIIDSCVFSPMRSPVQTPAIKNTKC